MSNRSLRCAITHTLIRKSDPVVLFPLHPYSDKRGSQPTLLRGAEVPSHKAYYTPFTLPLFGSYSGELGLDSIEKDANTFAIEEFFQLPIDLFVKTLFTERAFYQPSHPISLAYGNKDLDYHSSESDSLKENLLKMGFVPIQEDGDTFYFKDRLVTKVSVQKGDKGQVTFDLSDMRRGVPHPLVTGVTYLSLSSFLVAFHEHVGVLPHLDERHRKVSSPLIDLSVMVVHREAYDLLMRDVDVTVNPDYDTFAAAIETHREACLRGEDDTYLLDPFGRLAETLAFSYRLEHAHFFNIYKDTLKMSLLKESFAELDAFEVGLVRFSRAYFHSFPSHSDEDEESTAKLLSLSMKLNDSTRHAKAN